MNRIPATSMTFLRPSPSARSPLAGDITKAKSDVQAVMRDLSTVERGRFEREVPMETRVAEITPVSSTFTILASRQGLERGAFLF
jgi:hypothetical protein